MSSISIFTRSQPLCLQERTMLGSTSLSKPYFTPPSISSTAGFSMVIQRVDPSYCKISTIWFQQSTPTAPPTSRTNITKRASLRKRGKIWGHWLVPGRSGRAPLLKWRAPMRALVIPRYRAWISIEIMGTNGALALSPCTRVSALTTITVQSLSLSLKPGPFEIS